MLLLIYFTFSNESNFQMLCFLKVSYLTFNLRCLLSNECFPNCQSWAFIIIFNSQSFFCQINFVSFVFCLQPGRRWYLSSQCGMLTNLTYILILGKAQPILFLICMQLIHQARTNFIVLLYRSYFNFQS